MKKIYFAIAACAIFAFAACNNSTGTDNKDSGATDSPAAVENPAPAPTTQDSGMTKDSGAKTETAPAPEAKH
jgi:hypothetical protein